MGTLIKDGVNYTGVNEVELTLAEYMLLSEDERNNGTYYITDANLEGGVTGTAGTIKPYVYSEEEAVVGVYDGKPLYRKEIKKVLPNSTSQWEILTNIGISNIDTPVKISGMLGSQPIPCGEGSYYINLTFSNDGNVRINKRGWETTTPAILILEYTKTTDAAGSGNGLMPYGYVGGGGNECYHKYSTEEHIIGEWVDGSTLYEKTIVDKTPYNTEKTFNFDVDALTVNATVLVEQGGDREYFQLPRKHFNYPNSSIDMMSSSNGAIIKAGADFPLYGSTIMETYITIQYTKTTD